MLVQRWTRFRQKYGTELLKKGSIVKESVIIEESGPLSA
jgi:hypothetical protein